MVLRYLRFLKVFQRMLRFQPKTSIETFNVADWVTAEERVRILKQMPYLFLVEYATAKLKVDQSQSRSEIPNGQSGKRLCQQTLLTLKFLIS
jgi:hypothetical protein